MKLALNAINIMDFVHIVLQAMDIILENVQYAQIIPNQKVVQKQKVITVMVLEVLFILVIEQMDIVINVMQVTNIIQQMDHVMNAKKILFQQVVTKKFVIIVLMKLALLVIELM